MQQARNHIFEILSALLKDHIDFIVCGGVAVVLHGLERMTLDIDISISMNQLNVKKFLNLMEKLSLSPRAPIPAHFLADADLREGMIVEKNAVVFTFWDKDNAYRQIDVFLLPELSFENLSPHAEVMDFGSQKLNVLSKEKLIELKENIYPPREKDLFDIQQLKKMLK